MPTRQSSSVSKFAFIRNRTTYSLAHILACAAIWTSQTAVAATPVPRIALTVRVYHTANVPSELKKRALAEAETVLGAGRVDVRWQDCTGLNSSPTCDVPPGPSELLLVVRVGAGCQDTPATLGKALVVRRAGGVLATVYVNCIAWLATAARTDVAVLLGRVVAHELAFDDAHLGARAPRPDAPQLDAGRGSTKSRGGLGVHRSGRRGDAPAGDGVLENAACWGKATVYRCVRRPASTSRGSRQPDR